MKQKIKVEFLGEEAFNVCLPLEPASKYIPKWYKNLGQYMPTNEYPNASKPVIEKNQHIWTVKKCTPLLDGMTSGYIVPLWSDVQIRRVGGSRRISWLTNLPVFEEHGPSGDTIPSPPGYEQKVFRYISHFRVKTPRGYSCLIMPPSGFQDLPFHSMTAIVDTDTTLVDTNISVWVKEDIDNVIVEKGTPIAQIIPFKREDWKLEASFIDINKWKYEMDKNVISNLKNNYVRNFWTKKEFK
jgi:hypothetical protein